MPPRDHGPSDSGVERPVPVSPSSQSRRSVIPVVPGRVLDQELPVRSFQRLPLGTREPVTLHPHPSRCCQPPAPAPVRGHAPARPGRSHSQRTRICPPVRSAAWLHNHAGECAHLPPMRARRRRHAEPAHLRKLGFRIEPSLTPADQENPYQPQRGSDLSSSLACSYVRGSGPSAMPWPAELPGGDAGGGGLAP
jgi:hypothetical protein